MPEALHKNAGLIMFAEAIREISVNLIQFILCKT